MRLLPSSACFAEWHLPVTQISHLGTSNPNNNILDLLYNTIYLTLTVLFTDYSRTLI